jgi:hypothetical protein
MRTLAFLSAILAASDPPAEDKVTVHVLKVSGGG